MNQRHKKALAWATGALFIGLIPLIGRVWLEYHGALERADLGVAGEFLMRDSKDQPLSREHLRRSVSVLFYWPAQCGQKESCAEARKNVEATSAWVESKLTSRGGEDKNPLHLLVVGEGADQLTMSGEWRVLNAKPEPGTLLPQSADPTVPYVIVIDNMLQFAMMEPLNREVSRGAMDRILSKTTFDQYLGNYLAKRTFMGPRRTAP